MNRQALGALKPLLLLFLCLAAPLAQADDFVISSIETHLSDQVYVMNARVDYTFSKRALEALANGVPLTLRMDIEVTRKRNWLPDEAVAALEQYYQLNYHALSNSYLVRNLNSGALYAYPSQKEAIASLGNVRDFPLLDANLVSPLDQYEIDIRVVLDIDSLPSPLKLIAYVTPAWHLSSDWSTWSLKP